MISRKDAAKAAGRFVLTGSSTPQNKGVLHSGTGRIASLPMHPMSLWESGDSSGLVSLADVCAGRDIGVQNADCPSVDHLASLVVRGGWPGALGKSDAQAMMIPREYVEKRIRPFPRLCISWKCTSDRVLQLPHEKPRQEAGLGF